MNFISRDNLKIKEKFTMGGTSLDKNIVDLVNNANDMRNVEYALPTRFSSDKDITHLITFQDRYVITSPTNINEYIAIDKSTPYPGIYMEAPLLHIIDRQIINKTEDDMKIKYMNDRHSNFLCMFRNRAATICRTSATAAAFDIRQITEYYFVNKLFNSDQDLYDRSGIPECMMNIEYTNQLMVSIHQSLLGGFAYGIDIMVNNLALSEYPEFNCDMFERNNVPLMMSDMYDGIDSIVANFACKVYDLVASAQIFPSEINETAISPTIIYSSIMDFANIVVMNMKPVIMAIYKKLMYECATYYHALSMMPEAIPCQEFNEYMNKLSDGEIMDSYITFTKNSKEEFFPKSQPINEEYVERIMSELDPKNGIYKDIESVPSTSKRYTRRKNIEK